MLLKPKNKFTLKIVSGYLILGTLVVLAAIFIYSEFNDYSIAQDQGNSDVKLLKTNALITSLYEAENLSKLALQNGKRKSFQAYSKKVDTIYKMIETLKGLTGNVNQGQKLDSVQKLLQQKVYNNAELRKLKERNTHRAPIDSLLKTFNQMEIDLGRITPETLVPNFEELPVHTQNSLREYVAILNKNIPKNTSEKANQNELDSILHLSKSILNDAKAATAKIEQTMLGKELQIYKSDLELSQQLRSIISTFEQELMLHTYSESKGKQQLLKKGSNLAWTTAILSLLTIAFFTFLTVSDYWKGQRYREQLEKEKKFSESLLESREQLISTVSHDLRSPINSIKGFTELLEQGTSNASQRHYLKNLKSASAYVENLANDLLDFSKLECGNVHLEQRPYALSQLMEALETHFEEISLKKSIPLTFELTEEIKNPIVGDAFRMRQILTNLIGNAFKFTHQGFVKVKAFSEVVNGKSLLKIQVTDTGIGIEKDKQELIFKEFIQAKDSLQKQYGGYGLGLTISKKLTSLLSGTLSVESALNKGSTFTLTLPLILSDKNAIPVDLKESTLPSGTPSLIVLDDDQTLLELISEVCKINGIACKTFSSFQDFKRAADLNYTLLLSDIEMPENDGFDVVKTLKKGGISHYYHQPILAMTGQRGIAEDRYLSAGFDAVLYKPFSSKEFIAMVGKYHHNLEENPLTLFKEHNQSSNLFSTQLISSFVQDQQALVEVLNTFLVNTDNNLVHLTKAIKTRDYKKINGTAHKMLPMFRQLQIDGIIPNLEDLEHARQASSDDLQKTIRKIQGSFASVKKAMQAYVAKPSDDID